MKRLLLAILPLLAAAPGGCAAQSPPLASESGGIHENVIAADEDISWVGYDPSRHSNGWATMREDGGIIEDIDGQVMPIIDGKQGILVTRPGRKGYEELLEAVGGLKPGERKRIRSIAGRYDVTDAGDIIYHRFVHPPMVADTYLVHDEITASDPRYECYRKYLGYRQPGENYTLYINQKEMIGKCLAPAGLKP